MKEKKTKAKKVPSYQIIPIPDQSTEDDMDEKGIIGAFTIQSGPFEGVTVAISNVEFEEGSNMRVEYVVTHGKEKEKEGAKAGAKEGLDEVVGDIVFHIINIEIPS